ncbi:hypothetical protein [Solibacillus isronensis]|uniref:hypothetical protein n=1 Tax=Solibacillus isronensis TaxID=412383 RepID=UPI0009A67F6D|nr:hypothetical protein [Solibacillus isronensis]
MIDFSDGYSKEFKIIINNILDEIFDFFMEVGSNLHYDEIYATVFPIHKQDDHVYGMNKLKTLHRNIRDDFPHQLTPLDEYVLYHVLYFVYDSSDDGFNLDDIISKQLTDEVVKKIEHVDPDAVKLLRNTHTPYDVIGIIFEDVDFLEVGKLFGIYRNHPGVVTDFFHVDLDYYKELMPDDISEEYEYIKQSISSASKVVQNEEDSTASKFKRVVIDMVQEFKNAIEHKKGHAILNTPDGTVNEKGVQALFNIIANLYLKNTNVLVNSEVDTGRGSVDFYFSIGKGHRALIELKLGNHKRYTDGINYQLPTYLKAEDADFGVFVLICYTEEQYEKPNILYETAADLSKEYDKDIRFERVNASGMLKPASKIKSKPEMGFDD